MFHITTVVVYFLVFACTCIICLPWCRGPPCTKKKRRESLSLPPLLIFGTKRWFASVLVKISDKMNIPSAYISKTEDFADQVNLYDNDTLLSQWFLHQRRRKNRKYFGFNEFNTVRNDVTINDNVISTIVLLKTRLETLNRAIVVCYPCQSIVVSSRLWNDPIS